MILLLFGKDRVRNEMKKLLTVKSNVDLILGAAFQTAFGAYPAPHPA